MQAHNIAFCHQYYTPTEKSIGSICRSAPIQLNKKHIAEIKPYLHNNTAQTYPPLLIEM